MTELGLLLRKARMEKKISLDDLQETTKIRKRYLEAIEEGNFKVLPGNFYVRAFIKSYAEAVGLDPGEVLNLYQNVIPAAEPEKLEQVRTKRTTNVASSERFGRWASGIMVISFFVLIVGIIYYFVSVNYKGTADASNHLPNKITDKIEPAAPKPDTAGAATYGTGANAASKQPQPQVQAPEPVAPAAPVAQVKLAKSERGTDYYAVSGTDKLTVEVRVTGEECWMKIDSLGPPRQQLEEGMLKHGAVKTWELSNAAYVRFGRANAVELIVNGTTIPVGNEPNVKNIQLELVQS
ncbi:RodZ domain-containing protein [Paenibacillus sp. YYML68]|uniref:helix-turn-helix domain-containing protein n=1 Tax=Paenibacillus sp. YYML68 TaxID=2909250 RepID=UPI002491B10B|nr:RodZ domain-containing protein [Paenibacillus sp. YYML68]